MDNENQSPKIIEADNISIEFGDKAILSNVSFSVRQGDLIIVEGPSGGGKSTLLRILNRLQDPDSGKVYYNGRPTTDYDVVKLRHEICYLQQTPLMVSGTVKENLLLSFRFKSAMNAALPKDSILMDLLTKFKLSDISLSDNALNLSVGQKQRLSFLRVLLLKPRVMLLDEPTSALDSTSREIVERQIEELTRENGIAIIMVTHASTSIKNVKTRRLILSNATLAELT